MCGGCRDSALYLPAPQSPGTRAAWPPGIGDFLMALKCSNTTQEWSGFSHYLPTLCLSAAATAQGSGELHRIPALNSLDTFQQVMASLALGSSWVNSSSSCCAQQLPSQLMTGILVWRGMCCHLGLGCVDGSGQNMLGGGGTWVHAIAEILGNRRGWRPAVRMASSLG